MARKNPFLYYGKKVLIFCISIFVLSVAVFCVAHLAPGDPLASYYGDRVEKMTTAEREWAEEKLGLNEPVHVQYLRWLKNASEGDFGISFKYKTDVTEVIGARALNTLLLGGTGFLLIFVLSPLLGVLCICHENRWLDKIICKTGTLMSCIPEFWLSLVLILVFSMTLKWLPSGGAFSIGGIGGAGDRLLHLVLPLFVVVISHLWYYAYMIRNKLSEEVRAGYVLLAKAKGLGRGRIIFKHCLRNVMPSYLSIMAISVPHIMGGTYIVETVFSYPGIGTLSYESARYQDYNMLMVLCILSGAIVILCNIFAQIINERIDPRIREMEYAGKNGVVNNA